MSFEIFQQHFGELTEYVIQDPATGNRAVVIPELGGIVRQLSLRKSVTLFSILKTPPTPHALIEDSKSASELLFPFASRIPEGKYVFQGKTYQLAKNETGGLNAIHGLVRKQAFRLEEQVTHSDYAAITLSHTLENADGYPFHVTISVRYTLHANGTFELKYEALKKGADACPVMFGWHPYYQIGDEKADAWKISIPSDEIVQFDANQIPIGKELFQTEKPTLLYRKDFDNCFVISGNGTNVTTQLISENKNVTINIEQETGEGKFNHLVIYTPPARDCVAIEPLTANVDAFNSGDGLNIIPPFGTIDGKISVRLS
jgi:aldose 1-epimerase